MLDGSGRAGGKCAPLRRVHGRSDRVLEPWAGLGFISSVAAQVEGVERVISFEANPDRLPLIAETTG